ncbi:hypothetical protein PybrP1_010399 [[Pythium] brassicae (nom. inval.)]|nr:hypothetical protein PybrP1_010399 [[Pythium] brassicae (nom. inval.)]
MQLNEQRLKTQSEFGLFFDLRAITFGSVCVVCATSPVVAVVAAGSEGPGARQRFRVQLRHQGGLLTTLASPVQRWHSCAADGAEHVLVGHPARERQERTRGTEEGIARWLAQPRYSSRSDRGSRGEQRSRPRSFSSHLGCSSHSGPACQVCAERHPWPLTAHESNILSSMHQVDKRTSTVWSIVQLMNIVVLTDPLTLLGLLVVGHDLYLYRVDAQDQGQADDGGSQREHILLLLPCDPKTLAQSYP